MSLVEADSKIGRGLKDMILMKSNDQNIWYTIRSTKWWLQFKMLHRLSVCCWLDNVYIIMYIFFLVTKVAICHMDAIVQLFQQDSGITNYKTILNGICYKLFFQYMRLHVQISF